MLGAWCLCALFFHRVRALLCERNGSEVGQINNERVSEGGQAGRTSLHSSYFFSSTLPYVRILLDAAGSWGAGVNLPIDFTDCIYRYYETCCLKQGEYNIDATI